MLLQLVEVQFNCDMVPTTSQKHFLPNYQNNACFVDGLKVYNCITECMNQEIHHHIPCTELNNNVTYSIKNTQDNMSYTVKKYTCFYMLLVGVIRHLHCSPGKEEG